MRSEKLQKRSKWSELEHEILFSDEPTNGDGPDAQGDCPAGKAGFLRHGAAQKGTGSIHGSAETGGACETAGRACFAERDVGFSHEDPQGGRVPDHQAGYGQPAKAVQGLHDKGGFLAG